MDKHEALSSIDRTVVAEQLDAMNRITGSGALNLVHVRKIIAGPSLNAVERAKQTLANNRDISNFENVWGLYSTAIYAGEYEKAAEIVLMPPRTFDVTTLGSSEIWAGSA